MTRWPNDQAGPGEIDSPTHFAGGVPARRPEDDAVVARDRYDALSMLYIDMTEKRDAAEAEVRRLTEGLRQRIELLQALVRDRPPETEGRDTYADGVTAGAIAALQIVNDAEARALLSASPSGGGGAK